LLFYRWALKQAESIKDYQMYDLKKEEESETDEESKSSKTKSAVTITALYWQSPPLFCAWEVVRRLFQ